MTERGTVRLCAIGEFDTLNSRRLEASIRQAVADGFSRVLLDFSKVVFMDVSVVHALVRSWDVAAEQGCVMRIVDPSEAAALILDASSTRTILSPDQVAEDPAAGAQARQRIVIGRQSTRETVAQSRRIIDAGPTPPPEG